MDSIKGFLWYSKPPRVKMIDPPMHKNKHNDPEEKNHSIYYETPE